MMNANGRNGLRLPQLITLAFGTIVGVGWIVMLGQWLAQAGSIGALVAFLVGAVVISLAVLCYAELASMFPLTGGEVIYAFESLGETAAFWVGWVLALIYIGVTAFEAISMGWILEYLIPGIGGPQLYVLLGSPVHLGSVAIGLALMALITWVNYAGVKATSLVQDALTYVLIALSLIFVAAGIWGGRVDNLAPFFVEPDAKGNAWTGIKTVLLTAPFWYAGFSVVCQALGERASNEGRGSAGLAMMISIAAAFAFYALVILATSMAAPRPTLLTASLPAAAAFEAAFDSPLMSKIVLLAGVFGLLTTWNAVFYGSSRLLFALGRARFLPPILGASNGRGAPTVAILVVAAIASIATLAGRGAIAPIVQLSGAVFALLYALVAVMVIRLRIVRPQAERPYRVPGGLAIPVMAAGTSAALFALAIKDLIGGTGIAPELVVAGIWLLLGMAAKVLFVSRAPALDTERRRQLLLAGLGGS